MKLNYIKSQSTVSPEIVDNTSSKNYVYIRQNIVKKEIDDFTYYEYEEAKLTKDEYKQYLDELNGVETLKNVENLKIENQTLTEQIDMLMSCVLEMSEKIYE